MRTRDTLFGPEPVAEPGGTEPPAERKLTARDRQLTAKVKPIDRSQSMLVPLDVEELIGPDHAARAIWELTGKLDLRDFYEPIVSAEGRAGRRGWDPRLLLSVWLYACSRGENSARAIANEMSYEPALMWLAGLGEVNHDRLSAFRRNHQEALDELFAQLLTVMEEEGLVDLKQVMHDGTKIRAQAGVDSFRRRATLEQRLAEARELIRKLGDCEDEAGSRRRQAARERAARERVERLEEAMQQLQAMQAAKKEAEQAEVRVSLTEPEARWMKHGDNAITPSYNLQLSTDAQGMVIVGAHLTQQSSDSASLGPAMDVVVENLGRAPEQVIADGGYTNCDTIVEMAARQIDFVGSMSDPKARQAAALKASGIETAFGSAFFILHAESRTLECPAHKSLAYARQSRKRGNLYHQYQASGGDCQACVYRPRCCPKNAGSGRTVLDSDQRTGRGGGVSAKDAERRSAASLSEARGGGGISQRLDQGEAESPEVPVTRVGESQHRSAMGVPDVQRDAVDPA